MTAKKKVRARMIDGVPQNATHIRCEDCGTVHVYDDARWAGLKWCVCGSDAYTVHAVREVTP